MAKVDERWRQFILIGVQKMGNVLLVCVWADRLRNINASAMRLSKDNDTKLKTTLLRS